LDSIPSPQSHQQHRAFETIFLKLPAINFALG
jgi:hypothetical protein